MKIIDVFSGAGGLTEGFRDKEKFQIISHVELDKDACDSLKLRNIYYYFKEQKKLNLYEEYIKGSMTKEELYSNIPVEIVNDVLNLEINKKTLPLIFEYIDSKLKGENLDGIIGGPPCQAYSTIGRANNKAKKSYDSRIYLYKYYLSFLEKYSPKFFIFENVKGLLSFKDVEEELLLPKIINEFYEYGYNVEHRIVNANEYGVSQKRERLFLVGCRKDLKLEKSFFETLSFYKEEATTLKELLKDLPKINAGECSCKYSGENSNKIVEKYIRNKEENILTYHIARPHNKNDLAIYRLTLNAKKKGKNLRYDTLPIEMRTHSNTMSFLDRYKALDYNSVSHTVVAHISKDGHYYIHPDIKQNRSITVREAARIQGFPDNFFFENSRTSAFKQIGNAVPPILSKKIADSIIDFLGVKK